MIIKNLKSHEIKECETTPEDIYKQRRKFLKTTALTGILGADFLFSPKLLAQQSDKNHNKTQDKENFTSDENLTFVQNKKYELSPITPYSKASTFNNFYEFGMRKEDPAKYAHNMQTHPWNVNIKGEVNQPITLGIEDIFKRFPLEERIYRFRCVEAWSMTIPWIGFELKSLIDLAKPNSNAKYVVFETAVLESMPAIKNPRIVGGIPFPYIEGLRIDEATHPLTILAVGMYGKILPNQNGAPLRLIVPWKYGFKSIKSIVNITLTKQKPVSTWERLASEEYGFYANVNPNVNHPRWSQASERFIGEGFSLGRKKTLMFNGYGDEVGSLYANLDLRRNY